MTYLSSFGLASLVLTPSLSGAVQCECRVSLGIASIGKKEARNKKDADHFPS